MNNSMDYYAQYLNDLYVNSVFILDLVGSKREILESSEIPEHFLRSPFEIFLNKPYW